MADAGPAPIALVGTVTSDRIAYEGGSAFSGIGGILYQAAVLAGLGDEVRLVTNLGAAAAPEAEKLWAAWPGLDREGIQVVPGAGNVVNLFYPARGERREVLDSIVPPIEPERIAAAASSGCAIVLVALNSGFDIELEDWRRAVDGLTCPIWLDIHSLALDRALGRHRPYVALPEWRQWAKGVKYLQANRQEVACMLGDPAALPGPGDILTFAGLAFEEGVSAVFVTQGPEGVLVIIPSGVRAIAAPAAGRVVDTTGCGDVFCAGAVHRLVRGASLDEAATFGVKLAARAVGLSGVHETYDMARAYRT
jgi:sugar/nucleoside kinase (ribokinase family)